MSDKPETETTDAAPDVQAEPVVEVVEGTEATDAVEATDAEFLMWFYENIDLGDDFTGVRDLMATRFREDTGKLAPAKFRRLPVVP